MRHVSFYLRTCRLEKLVHYFERFWSNKNTYGTRRIVFLSHKACQIYKGRSSKYGEPQGSIVNTSPLEAISTDLAGPFPSCDYNNNTKHNQIYIKIFTDRGSKFTKIYTTENAPTYWYNVRIKSKVVKYVQKTFHKLSDQGSFYM